MPFYAKAKSERVEVRFSPKDKKLLMASAHSQGVTLSEFILSSALAAAREAILESEGTGIGSLRRVYTSEAGWQTIQEMFEREDQELRADVVARLKPRI